jgi:hypothetical protein
MSSCRHSTRSAEQRCPAEWNAECTASLTTCSGSAEESTIIAFWPPVSAIRAPIGPDRAARLRLIDRATSTEPVKATPATLGSATRAAPSSPAPSTFWNTAGGTPAARSRRAISDATSGVCSAGLAITALPATSAAATCPV